MSSQESKPGSGGVLTFVSGLVVGLVMGTLGAIFAPKAVDGNSSSSRRKKPADKPSRPVTIAAPREALKMVMCVNMALGMGKGKTAAQCAHAAVGVIQKYKARNEDLFKMWERFGQPKIALKVKDEEVLAELAHKALQSNIPCYIVHDAGRTQVAAGSQTVLAIGPGYRSEIDRITGKLSLL